MKSSDLSAIDFRPMPGLDGVDAFILDIDDERGVVDALFRFAPDAVAPLHNHLAQTNMFILDGELRMYHPDGSLRETRSAGTYHRGKRDDAHLEGGGPDGAVVFYSIRRHGPEELVDVLDDDGNATSTLTLSHVRKMLAAQG